ncbi:MAG: hypothetical protein WC197_00050 [Candidatus Gastranaerophilaceae bacterium]|jgi:uncharacterized protein YabN with tetrapyrrole methylase and pyrophosphatase domain
MDIKYLSDEAKKIWGEENLSLAQIIVRLGKVYGDICRWERNAKKDVHLHTDDELMKEFGNLIFTTIKFAQELGYDPEECIERAIEAQRKYVAEKNE